MSVTLKLARAFVAVASSGSFTRAAESLNITQPALTVQIRQLEQLLGVQLFSRNTRYVALTASGRILAGQFRKLLNDWDALVNQAQKMGVTPNETLRIGCLPSLSGSVLPELVSEFMEQHPEVEVIVRDLFWERVLAMVRSGEVDVAIGIDRGVLSDLDVTPLATEPMFVVYPEGHDIGRLPEVTIQKVVEYPLVLVSTHSSVRRSIEASLASSTPFVFPVKEVMNSASAVGLVRAGFGLTVLPSAAMELRAKTGLHCRKISDCFRHIVLLRRRGILPSHASAAFAAMVTARFEGILVPLSDELVTRESLLKEA